MGQGKSLGKGRQGILLVVSNGLVTTKQLCYIKYTHVNNGQTRK